jgi:3-oxoacyl-[acyl-carrier-protein] synthase III
MIRTIIVGTGSFIPETIVPNETFSHTQFFNRDGTKLYQSNSGVLQKFSSITGIKERRYAKIEQVASDLACIAAEDAITSSDIDKETIDYIIVSHNFGDVSYESNRVNIVPSLASRVKRKLGIQNPDCIAYDLAFGCPGWLEGMIHANSFICSGMAKRCLVIGAETLSRVIDPHDRDSMIYGDGAGAVILEAVRDTTKGILSHKTRTYALDHSMLLSMNHSYSPYTSDKRDLFLKMNGRKVYEFALSHVPTLLQTVLNSAALDITAIDKILIHQANDKMDMEIVKRLFKLYGHENIPASVMPMTIAWLGNSSVATVPTLLDLILKGKLEGHEIKPGNKVMMASLGAGMNVNALVYQF